MDPSASLCDNFLRSGERAVGIGLQLTIRGEDVVQFGFSLGPPAVEVGGSTRTVCGVSWPGRISLGTLLPWTPPCQASSLELLWGGGGSSLNLAASGVCLVMARLHCDFLPLRETSNAGAAPIFTCLNDGDQGWCKLRSKYVFPLCHPSHITCRNGAVGITAAAFLSFTLL